MEQIVFVLGLPGSGKSTAARYIEMLARDYGWTAYLLQDYRILYEMFLADREGVRFSSTLYDGFDGFDVHDLSAFDDALKELVHQLQEKERTSKTNEMNIIEFARDDYCKALELFASIPMTKAFFLFIDAEVETCKQRIEARVTNPQTPDDHYVSEYIFEAYYNRDHRKYLTLTTACLTERFHIDEKRIKVVDNTNGVTTQAFLSEVEEFVSLILREQIPISSRTS
jgi:deoxyadenosine/deoxycytidine kinase